MIFDRGFNLLRLLSPAVLNTVFDIFDNYFLETVFKFCFIFSMANSDDS